VVALGGDIYYSEVTNYKQGDNAKFWRGLRLRCFWDVMTRKLENNTHVWKELFSTVKFLSKRR
jgi:hypothetical protein